MMISEVNSNYPSLNMLKLALITAVSFDYFLKCNMNFT